MRVLTSTILAAFLGSAGAAQRFLTPATVSNQHQLAKSPTTPGKSALQGNRFNKKKKDNSTCPTYGESQWTGTINVGEGHDLFYRFFDSRNDPDNDPIIL